MQLNGTGTLGNNIIGTAGTLNLAGGTLNTSANRTRHDRTRREPDQHDGRHARQHDQQATTVELNFSNDNIVATAGTLTFRNVGALTAADTFQPRFSGNFNFSRPIVIDNSATGKTRLMSFNTGGASGLLRGNLRQRQLQSLRIDGHHRRRYRDSLLPIPTAAARP